MPQAATENRVTDAIIARLQTIGTPPSSWLVSTPEVSEGVPPNPLPKTDKPRLYVEHAGTLPRPEDAGTSTHWMRVQHIVWCTAATPRDVLSLKADVLRALFAGESTLTSALGQPVFPGEFAHRRDMTDAGIAVGQQVVFVDMEVSHATP